MKENIRKIKSNKANSRFDFLFGNNNLLNSKRSTRALMPNLNKILPASKRSQHEIVGFVLIIIIVVIIGLFLLVFYLRQEPVRYESLNVQNFLQASMLYTTECAIGIEPLDLQELIKSCYSNEKCSNEEMACDVLNDTLSELVHESWLVSPDRPVKAYFLDIYYEEKYEKEESKGEKTETVKQEILSLQEGNCTGSKTGAEHFLHQSPGNIIIIMELCYT